MSVAHAYHRHTEPGPQSVEQLVRTALRPGNNRHILLRAHKPIINPGVLSCEVLLVKTGLLAILRPSQSPEVCPRRKWTVVGLAGPKDVVIATSLHRNHRYRVEATNSKTSVVAVPLSELGELRNNIWLAQAVQSHLYTCAEEALFYASFRNPDKGWSVDKRLAEILIYFLSRWGICEGQSFPTLLPVFVGNRTIGNLICVSEEEVGRSFARLTKAGIIERVEGQRLRVRQYDALYRKIKLSHRT